jgi:3-deoxy-7-phosphoheptulonate synthase
MTESDSPADSSASSLEVSDVVVNNLNITHVTNVPRPHDLKERFPLTADLTAQVSSQRLTIENILDGKDRRLLVVVGPCSLHHKGGALDYGQRLAKLAQTLPNLFLVMRAYGAKPRTTTGWKGLIYDPSMDGSNDLNGGITLMREIAHGLAMLGLPLATEVLDPFTIEFFADLISWASIGARTVESQTHRELASGLSMPVGFKNATEGGRNGTRKAVDAVQAAKSPHTFWGISDEANLAFIETRGNPYGHVVLRGGDLGPNYQAGWVQEACDLLNTRMLHPQLVIDCSHDNTKPLTGGLKDFRLQAHVLENVVRQRKAGNRNIVGVMLESNVVEGNVKIPDSLHPSDIGMLMPGRSVTDACLSWQDTERLLMDMDHLLQ